jgi:formylmethanofuran dehydrogenase subunit E
MIKFFVIFSFVLSLWANDAPNATPILVKDTDSALGRLNLRAKKLDLDTLVKIHGHLCDGLVISYVELSALLKKIFPNGIVDRTDLRVVAKNSPCLADAGSLITGARINFKTLSLDNSMGLDFIVQQISTGKTYRVTLKDKAFIKELKTKEKEIKSKMPKNVTAKEIDDLEALADSVIKHMLYTDVDKLVSIKELKNYKFHFSTKDFGKRSDVVYKNVKR